MWGDQQTTTLEDTRVDSSRRRIKPFHTSLHFLYCCPTEIERETMWNNICHMEKFCIECWYFADKICPLLAFKSGWLADNFGDDIWVMSLDGVNFVTYEPSHEPLSKDLACFLYERHVAGLSNDLACLLYEHHAAGFDHEIGIRLYESKLIWLNGPFKAGTFNDTNMFCGWDYHLQRNGDCRSWVQCTGYLALVSTRIQKK